MGHRGLEVTVHRPVLGSLGQQWSTIDSFSVLFFLANRCYLVVAERDGEPSIVAVDDLYAVVSRAAGTVFIGPESDHWLCLSLTHSLTHSLTP